MENPFKMDDLGVPPPSLGHLQYWGNPGTLCSTNPMIWCDLVMFSGKIETTRPWNLEGREKIKDHVLSAMVLFLDKVIVINGDQWWSMVINDSDHKQPKIFFVALSCGLSGGLVQHHGQWLRGHSRHRAQPTHSGRDGHRQDQQTLQSLPKIPGVMAV